MMIAMEARERTLRVAAVLDNEERVQEFLAEALTAADCPKKTRNELRLAVEELFVNVARHAYEGNAGDVEIRVREGADAREASVTLRDSGAPFDPFARQDPEKPRSIEEATIGGLGIVLVKRMTDGYEYRYEDGCNVVTIVKRW